MPPPPMADLQATVSGAGAAGVDADVRCDELWEMRDESARHRPPKCTIVSPGRVLMSACTAAQATTFLRDPR